MRTASLILSSLVLLSVFPGPGRGQYTGGGACAAGECSRPPLLSSPPRPPHAVPGPRCDFTPAVALEVLVPDRVAAGRELVYRIRVVNRSAADAHHVVVHNVLPANARYLRADPEPIRVGEELQWRLGTLGGGECRSLALVLEPTGKGDVDNCVRVTSEHGLCVTTRVGRAGLSLIKRGPPTARRGEVIAFELVAGNPSETPLQNVVLTDKLPEELEHVDGGRDLTWVLGTLHPGQSRTVRYRAVARGTGKLCNRAAVTADGGLRETAEHCIEVTEARLGLVIAGPGKQYLNGLATYRLTVTNAGESRVDDALITYLLPQRSVYARSSDDGRHTPGQVQWLVPPLAPKESRTVEVQIRPQALGVLEHRAFVEGGGAKIEAAHKTEIIGAAGLLIQVADQNDPILVGQETVYRIVVLNQGTLPVTNVRIAITVPKQMQVANVQGSAKHQVDGQKLLFDPLDLPAKKEAEYRITVKAIDSGSVRFRVELSADPLTSGPVVEEESTSIVRE